MSADKGEARPGRWRAGALDGAACYYPYVRLSNAENGWNDMTLCPIAIAVGCKKCPAFTVCPLKGVIGDYRKPENSDPKRQADGAKRDK